jgi:hypothetical protein
VTIDRPGATLFTYGVGYFPATLPNDELSYVEFLTGSFAPGGTISFGSGELHAHTDVMRTHGVPLRGINEDGTGLENILAIDTTYNTGIFPWTVHTVITGSATSVPPNSTTEYDTTRAADDSRTMMFISPSMDTPGDILSVESRWLPSGAGRSQALVTSGPNSGGRWTECWDGMFQLTYEDQNWSPPPTGDVLTCIP